MTRKHFQAIADVLRFATERHAGDPCTRDQIAREMADFLATQNPNFKRTRFLDACGVDS